MRNVKNGLSGAMILFSLLVVFAVITGPLGWFLVWATRTSFGISLQIGQSGAANWLWYYPGWGLIAILYGGMLYFAAKWTIGFFVGVGEFFSFNDPPSATPSTPTTAVAQGATSPEKHE